MSEFEKWWKKNHTFYDYQHGSQEAWKAALEFVLKDWFLYASTVTIKHVEDELEKLK